MNENFWPPPSAENWEYPAIYDGRRSLLQKPEHRKPKRTKHQNIKSVFLVHHCYDF